MTDPSTRTTDAPRRASFAIGDFDVEAGDAPYSCGRCGRPFEREAWLDLHRGNAHPEDLTDGEIERFRAAHEDEEASLRRFRLLALGGLVLIYFGLLLIYAILAL